MYFCSTLMQVRGGVPGGDPHDRDAVLLPLLHQLPRGGPAAHVPGAAPTNGLGASTESSCTARAIIIHNYHIQHIKLIRNIQTYKTPVIAGEHNIALHCKGLSNKTQIIAGAHRCRFLKCSQWGRVGDDSTVSIT